MTTPTFEIKYSNWLDVSILIGYIFVPASTGIKYTIECGEDYIETIEGYYIECRIAPEEEKTYLHTLLRYEDDWEGGASTIYDCDPEFYSKWRKEGIAGRRRGDQESAICWLDHFQKDYLDYINSIIRQFPSSNNFTIQLNYKEWYKIKEGWTPVSLLFHSLEFCIPKAYLYLKTRYVNL